MGEQSNNKNENLICRVCAVCCCALGSVETKEWFVLSGEDLASSGTSAGGGGKDTGQMEAFNQGEQEIRDGLLH